MAYSLRPKDSRKLPARYRQTDDNEDDNPPHPRPADNGTTSQAHNCLLPGPEDLASSTNMPPPPRPSSLTTQHPRLSQPAGVDFASITNPNTPTNVNNHRRSPERLNMANIKIVKAAPRRSEGEDQNHRDLPSRSRTGRVTKASLRDPTPPALPIPKPAAFPSLPTDVSPPPQVHPQNSGHSMKELFEAMEDDDEERVSAIKQRVDHMYESDTSELYTELRGRWAPKQAETTITFESLWCSLRQTIIEEIQKEFPGARYKSPFYPAQRILNLSTEKLATIMSDNAEVWETEDDIPAYYRELRIKHPNMIINPDEPPPAEVVKAIRFLKQQSLPGGLLGEWHALPPIEAFAGNSSCTVKEEIKSSSIRQESSSRETPNILSHYTKAEFLAGLKADRSRVARARKAREVKVEKKICKLCGRKGHTQYDLGVDWLHKCPTQRWHITHAQKQLDLVRQQATAEIEAIKQRDLFPESQPLPPPMDPRTETEYNKWRAGYFYRVRVQHPRTREEYIEQEHTANQRTPFIKANYFEMYESIQRGEVSLDGSLGHAGTKMVALHAKDLRRRRRAAEAEEMRKRGEELIWPNTPFLVGREVKSREVIKVEKKREGERGKEGEERRQQQGKEQKKTDTEKNSKVKKGPVKQATAKNVSNAEKPQEQSTPQSKAIGKKRGPYKKREKKPQDATAPKRVVSKDGMVSLATSAQASEVLAEVAKRKCEEQGSKGEDGVKGRAGVEEEKGEGDGGVGGGGGGGGDGAANKVDSPMQEQSGAAVSDV